MFSNIGHVEEILIDSPFPKRVPEQRLMCPGGAGGDNHAIETFFPDRVGYLLGRIGGTYEEAFFGMSDIV